MEINALYSSSAISKQIHIKCDAATKEEIKNSFKKVKDFKLPYIKDVQNLEDTQGNEVNKDLDTFKIKSKILKACKSSIENQFG